MNHITKVKYDYYNKEIEALKQTIEPGLRKIQILPKFKLLDESVECILSILYRFIKLRDDLIITRLHIPAPPLETET